MRLKKLWNPKERKWEYVTAVILCILVAIVCIININNPITYQMYKNGATDYNRGAVVEVTKESLEAVSNTAGRYLGKQELVVMMKSGPHKGETVVIENTLSTTQNILVRAGQSLIIRVEQAANAEPYFSVFNYDRTPGIVAIVLIFFILTILVGKSKGLRSVLGLLFTLFFIVAFLIPMVYNGHSPILYSIITVIVTSTASLILLNGISKKTACAVIATIAGVAISGGVFCIFSAILHLSGFNVSETEELLVISNNTGLQIGELLFAGLLISSLGAIMDTALSLSSALYEMKQVSPSLTFRQMMSSGMNIGKDMIGTMTNTLILAYTGTAIVTLIVLCSFGLQFDQLMSSDYIAIEIVQGASGAIGIVLDVFLTSAISAAVFTRDSE